MRPNDGTEATGSSGAGGTPGATPIRVLVVDDEPDLRALLRIVLEGDGHHVVGEAGDGTTALALWREHRPDVLLLDQQMPGMTGSEVARLVLAEQPGQRIVFVTANPDRTLEDLRDLDITVVGKERLTELPRILRQLLHAA